MAEAVIVEAVRSPVGKRNGGLSGVHPGELSAQVLNGLAERAGIDPGDRRRRHLGLRHAGRRAGARHRAHRGAGGGLARERARRDRRPAVRVQPAVRPLRRGRRGGRPLRRRRRRWRRVDVAHPDGRLAGQRWPPVPGGVPQPLHPDPEPGHRRRDDRRAVGLRPHRARSVLAGSHEKAAAAQDSGAFDDQIVASRIRTAMRPQGRGHPSRWHHREDGRPQARVQGGRRDPRGQLQPDLRRLGRAAVHVGREGEVVGPQATCQGAHRHAGRRRSGDHADRTDSRPPRRR